MSKIEPKSIAQLEGYKFFVPLYQRGYRWSSQQVRDLIDDISEFISIGQKGIYCIQPLVVRYGDEGWHIIDGQQRLTTINILLSCLGLYVFDLCYQTRQKSEAFLKNIIGETEEDSTENIDFYYMFQACRTYQSMLDSKDEEWKKTFKDVLLNKVKFIWYDTDEQDPIDVFKRLNIDKISLTPSELIKALLLNRNNFDSKEGWDQIHLRQQEIASEWDAIEGALQKDEFWLFFHDEGYKSATRIDYLFEMLCDHEMLDKTNEEIGTDDMRVFRYVYDYFRNNGYSHSSINYVWGKVKSIYETLQEWFSDLEMYHYIGFLMARPTESTRNAPNEKKMKSLLFRSWSKWSEKDMDVMKFKKFLHQEIQNSIDGCKNIDADYDVSSKVQCRPLLLLHNVLTVISQGKVSEKTYGQKVFYKFPFNLYKKEMWDVEHVDSNTENELDDPTQQKEWLLTNYYAASDKDAERIRKFFSTDCEDENKHQNAFKDIAKSIVGKQSRQDRLDESKNEKNRVWNFTLLDQSTNRSYGNAIFPAKRRIIIGKEQGKYYPCPKYTKNKGFEIQPSEHSTSAFIMPCTKQVFMKYYSPMSTSMNAWTRSDAKSYREAIISMMEQFNFNIEYKED